MIECYLQVTLSDDLYILRKDMCTEYMISDGKLLCRARFDSISDYYEYNLSIEEIYSGDIVVNEFTYEEIMKVIPTELYL